MSVERKKYCVDGVWKESKTEKWMEVTDSSTGEIIAEVPCCTVDEVEEEPDVEPAAEYQIAFKYKSVGDLTDSAKFKIEFYDENGSNFTSANAQKFGWTEKGWEDRGVTFNTPNEPTLKSASP